MTDFSFQNKAYDLLLNLAEDRYNASRLTINSVKELRLLIDIVKDTYPIYANADTKSIIDFVKDIFGVEATSTQISMANQEIDEIYRPVESWEIKPGTELKIVEESGTWCHTFWTYADTNRIIPPENTTLLDYHRAYMYIWEKAQKGKVFIKNIYKYKIGDIVRHKDDRDSLGIIKSRLPANKSLPLTKPYEFLPNAYSITWLNTGINPEVPLVCWYNEDCLIKSKMLEALPMKTNTKIDKPKKRKLIEYKSYDPEEWLKQQLTKGYDKAVMLTLLQKNVTNGVDPDKEFGWVIKYKKAPFRRADAHKNNAIKRRDNRIKRKNKRIYPFVNEIKKQKEPLVSVKWIITGEIARIEKSYAKQLVERNNGNYIYANKTEWRKYLKEIKPEPKLCLPKGKDIMGHEYALGNRAVRRSLDQNKKYSKPKKWQTTYPKQSKEDRLEQSKLDRYKHYEKRDKKSLDDLKQEFASDERRNDHFSIVESWSRTFAVFYKFISLPKKGVKAVFNNIIKYKHKFAWSEEKISNFIRYLRLTTHGVFTGPKPVKSKKVKQVVEHEPIKWLTLILDPTKLSIDENKNVIDKGGGMTQVPIKYRRKRK